MRIKFILKCEQQPNKNKNKKKIRHIFQINTHNQYVLICTVQ